MTQKFYNYLIPNEKENSKSLLGENTFIQNNIIIQRCLTTREFSIFRNYIDFYKFFKTIKENERCFFETVLSEAKRKMYFDIDINLSEYSNITKEECDKMIETINDKIEENLIQENEIMVFTSHTEKKLSYHIIINKIYFNNNEECKYFYNKVITDLESKYIPFLDDKVYNKTQQFRIWKCHKFGKNNSKTLDKNLSRRLTECKDHEILKNSLLSHTVECQEIKNLEIVKKVKEKGQDIEINDGDIKDILDLFYIKYNMDDFVYDNHNTREQNIYINLKRLNPTYCELCDRIHENDNPYILVDDKKDVYLDCRRNKNNQKMFLGTVLCEEETKSIDCYNIFKDIEKENFKREYKAINREKLSKINKTDMDYVKIEKGKNYVIRSDTGTGKTTLIIDYIKKNKEYNFISIVSRVSLGNNHHNDFKNNDIRVLNYNNYDDYYFEDGDNIIVQLDSIMRLGKIDYSKYIIILDEFNSLINYLISSTTLKDKRTLCLVYLLNILSDCKKFFCVDADITQNSLEILDFLNLKFEFFINEFKHNKGVNSEEIFNYDYFINKVKKHDKFIICCDRKTDVETIYKDLKDESIKIITSETSEEDLNLDDYDKVIYSPKVIYGLDSQMRRPVFAFYSETTINPESMVQQICRCRNIVKLYYLFYKKKYVEPKYKSIEEVKEYVSNLHDVVNFRNLVGKDKNSLYMKLLSSYLYKEDCYKTNVFLHFKKLIEERGFVDMNLKGHSNVRKVLIEKSKAVKEDKVLSFDPEDDKVTKLNEILEIPEDKITEYKELFINPWVRNFHWNVRTYFLKQKDDVYENLKHVNEFNVNKATFDKNKIIFLTDFLKLLNCEKKNDLNFKSSISPDIASDVFNKYKKIFRNKLKKDLDLTVNYNCKKLIVKMYKQLFGLDIINDVRVRDLEKNVGDSNDRIRVFNLNYDYLNYHFQIINFKTKIKNVDSFDFTIGKEKSNLC